MLFADAGYALGGSDDAEQLDAPGTRLLDDADSRRGAAPGCEHRIEDERVALTDVAGKLAEVLDGLQRGVIAVQAEMADPGVGNQRQDAVHHHESGPQYAYQGHLLAFKVAHFGGGD